MPEIDTIGLMDQPVTQAQLLHELRALGIRPGDTLIVHSSMSKIGWVCGREVAVVQALLGAVGRFGTLIMPAHSGDNSEPSDWRLPPVPQSWFIPIRENMPAYRRRVTPLRSMGRIAECFRTWPGTRRSAHPHLSWCAHGPGAWWLLRGHRFGKLGFGMASPLGRMYRREAKILLLGVGYDNCTSLHLAETLCPGMPQLSVGAAVRVRGKRRWESWREIELNSDRFPELGKAYEQSGGKVTHGRLGMAECRVLPIRPLVDYGVRWLTENPPPKEEN